MKNQYFGDSRDYVKYGILMDLVAGLPSIHRLTLIAMLTPDDKGTDGGNVNYCSREYWPELHDYLRLCRSEDRREVRLLREHFADTGIDYRPYGDDWFFRHSDRERYFARVPDEDLSDAVVFLDPDNGLEVPSMSGLNGHKYVRWAEVKGLYDRMNNGALVVYQHLPHVKTDAYLEQRMEELRQCVGSGVVGWILRHPVAYLIITHQGPCAEAVGEVLRRCSARPGFRASCVD